MSMGHSCGIARKGLDPCDFGVPQTVSQRRRRRRRRSPVPPILLSEMGDVLSNLRDSHCNSWYFLLLYGKLNNI